MTKKIITLILLIILHYSTVSAETNFQNSPFSPEADSYIASIKNNFENLPTITEPTKHNIEGTEKIAETQTQKKLTGEIYHVMFDKYDNSKIIGKPNIIIKGPVINNNKKIYFWIITGNIQFYLINRLYKTSEKRNEKFFYVIHFDKYYNKWKEDYLIVGEKVFTIDAEIQNAVAIVSEPLLKQKNETLHNTAIKKEKWTFNNREIQGKLINYNNGKVHIIQNGNKKPFQMDVTKFSLDDQTLIRGYIDHLGIPVRELQTKKKP
jgi:hypothetical protein